MMSLKNLTLLTAIATGVIVYSISHFYFVINQNFGTKKTLFDICIAIIFLNSLLYIVVCCYILWQSIINNVGIWMSKRIEIL